MPTDGRPTARSSTRRRHSSLIATGRRYGTRPSGMLLPGYGDAPGWSAGTVLDTSRGCTTYGTRLLSTA